MLIDLKHEDGSHLQTTEVSLSKPPAVLRPAHGEPIALEWDRAVDDEMHLRRCPVCGCTDLYVKKRIPQLTVFALIVLSAIVIMALFGIGLVRVAVVVLAVLAVGDLLVYLYAGRELVCYRCGTHYRKLPISRSHPRWDQAVAERYRAPHRRPRGAGRASAGDEPDKDAEAEDAGAAPP